MTLWCVHTLVFLTGKGLAGLCPADRDAAAGGAKTGGVGYGWCCPAETPPNLLAVPLTPGRGQSKESVQINQSLPE